MNKLIGTVKELFHYPLKSMQGHKLPFLTVLSEGVLGDRAFALIDLDRQKPLDARKEASLLAYEAAFTNKEQSVVTITGPNEFLVNSDEGDASERLSKLFRRNLQLRRTESPSSGFADEAAVHLVTTSTLNELSRLHTEGVFDPLRFRPNVVIETEPELSGFVESAWLGSYLRIGQEVVLRIDAHCERCVMTTLPQRDLAHDPVVLKTAAAHNENHVGIYASVVSTGSINLGDEVFLESEKPAFGRSFESGQ